MATAAPAAKACLAQATAKWPNRNKASDGILSSDAHQRQNPSSDHDYGNAVDLTHDPANGCDAHRWVRELVKRRDPRVKYAISNGKIWSLERASEGWRDYNGANAHTKHAHVSIFSSQRSNTANWFPVATKDDDDMTPEQAKQLAETHAWLKQLTAPRREDKTDVDPNKLSLADLYTLIEKNH